MEIKSEKSSSKKDNKYFNIYDFKLDIEGDTVEYDMNEGKAVSCLPFIPADDQVVVRGIFTETVSRFTASNVNKIKQDNTDDITIVAVGSKVKDFKVGDKVAMPYNPSIQQIIFNENKRSIDGIIKHLKSSKSTSIITDVFRKVKAVEYMIAPSYAIKGIFL